MKKLIQYTAIAVLALGNAGCNDSFLDKAPTTTISEVTAFDSTSLYVALLRNVVQYYHCDFPEWSRICLCL